MKKFLVAAAAVGAMASIASASQLIYEPFDYPTGPLVGNSNASTGTSWLRASTATSATAINVASGSLTPPANEGPAVGNELAITGVGNSSGAANRLAFAPAATPNIITSGPIYYSFTLRVDSVTGSNVNAGGFFVALNNTGDTATTNNPSTAPAKIQMRTDPTDTTKYDLEIVSNRNATAADPNWSVIPALTVGDSHFIVASYDLTTHVSSLWIDPDSSTFGTNTPPAPTETDNTETTSPTQIGSIFVRQSPTPQLTLDEMRVSTDWQYATSVPEPTMLGLAGVAGIGLLRRRRRH